MSHGLNNWFHQRIFWNVQYYVHISILVHIVILLLLQFTVHYWLSTEPRYISSFVVFFKKINISQKFLNQFFFQIKKSDY